MFDCIGAMTTSYRDNIFYRIRGIIGSSLLYGISHPQIRVLARVMNWVLVLVMVSVSVRIRI